MQHIIDQSRTKKDRCIELMITYPELERAELIELFVSHIGLTKAAASTYASMLKKEIGDISLQNVPTLLPEETDAEIAQRLAERFHVIDILAQASTQGKIRSLIVSGPAGLGKSFTIEQAIKQYDPESIKSIIARGFVRATGLYLLLHQFRHEGDVIVLDDADSIFDDMNALNLLKAACDTTEERSIHWRAETRMTDQDGDPIPTSFVYNGTIIFITNRDFDRELKKGGKGAEHYEALISRSHYIECDMHTIKEYIIRIKQVVASGMLRDQKDISYIGEYTILDFIEHHATQLRELTLRMALKLADIYNLDEGNFEKLARVSCFKANRFNMI